MKSIITIYIMSYLIMACSPESTTPSIQENPPVAPAANVQFKALQKINFEQHITCQGIIDVPPQNRADVVAPFGGIVQAVHVYPTEAVTKGQVLLEVQGEPYLKLQEDFLALAAQIELLRADFKRKSTMKAGNATSQKAFEQAKFDFKQAEAQLQGVTSRLRYAGLDPDAVLTNGIQNRIKLKAPMDGYITQVNASVGKSVRPEMPLLQLINKSHMHLELTVFEKDIQHVQLHQPIRFSVEGYEPSFRGEVFLIGEELDPTNRSIRVHGHLEEELPQLKPGMYVTATITTYQDSVYALPTAAVIERDGQLYAYVKGDKGQPERKELKQRYRNDAYVVPEDTSFWKTHQVALDNAYLLQDVMAGHSH